MKIISVGLFSKEKPNFPDKMQNILHYFESDNYVYFEFVYNNILHFFIKDRNNGSHKIFNNIGLKNDLLGVKFFPITKAMVGNSLVCHVYAHDLLENRGKLKVKIPDDLTPNSNPVLVFFHPKSKK